MRLDWSKIRVLIHCLLPIVEWCSLTILKLEVTVEDEALDLVDIKDIFILEMGIIMLEEECSLMHIPEVSRLVVTVLAKATHYRCNFTNHDHMLDLHLICPMVKLDD